MRILVTGAAGSVAAGIIRTLSKHHSLTLLDLIRSEKFIDHDWIEGSILDSVVLQRALSGVQAVVNLAIVRSESSEEIFDVNVKGLYLLLEAVQEAGVQRFVQISSTATVIGHWDTGENITIHSPYTTRGRYSLTKVIQETICEHIARNSDVQIVVLRPWHPFDRTVSSEPPDYFPGLIDSEELGQACHLALTNQKLSHFEIFHIMATQEAQARFDTNRTQKILGFQPKIFTEL